MLKNLTSHFNHASSIIFLKDSLNQVLLIERAKVIELCCMGCPLIHQLSCVCHVNLYICKDTWEWHNLTPMKLPKYCTWFYVMCLRAHLCKFVLVIKIWLMFYFILIIYSLRNLQNKIQWNFSDFFFFLHFFFNAGGEMSLTIKIEYLSCALKSPFSFPHSFS
jgi:hypothetical protein